MNHNRNYGQLGEELAAHILAQNGYTNIERNVRIGNDEIDIVAQKSGFTIFIEIKTRLSNSMGFAEDQFSHRKISRLKRSAVAYCQKFNIHEEKIKIEAMAINLLISDKTANISHFKYII